MSSPLLGVSGPRRAEKGGNEIFVTIGVNGEFLHFGVEPSRSAKAFLQGAIKSFKFFTISRLYVHISQKRVKIDAYKQRTQNLYPPLSNCRMCMDPSLTGFYSVGQKLRDL